MNLLLRTLAVSVTLACAVTARAEADEAAGRLRVGMVQMALGSTLQENRDRIRAGISQVAARGARVAVFPEGALRAKDDDEPALVAEAVAAIRLAALERKVYVVFGGASPSPASRRLVNWMSVAGPDGSEIFRYDMLYDKHDAKMPDVFPIDGNPCSAMICADRWLRGVEEIPIQQGAKVSFELSCNFASEWIPAYEWYWNVPRALRNGVWVIFANTGNEPPGVPAPLSASDALRHGHSAMIAPDGRIEAAARDSGATCVIAEIDIGEATRAVAKARAAHPALQRFWEAGLRLHGGQQVVSSAWTPLRSAETDITIAAAQVKDSDLVVFPERAIQETAFEALQRAARKHAITLVVGMEHRGEGGLRNSAFVLGPDGSVITRYDQLSATAPYQPGSEPASMWFRVKGVPAVVTIGRDALWTELAELAAVAGAQVHVHLHRDASDGHDADLRRLQVWSNLASYRPFSATVNVAGSTIWDDLRGADESRGEVRGLPRPDTGPVEVYSPFSANVVVRAKQRERLIAATRRVSGMNRYHPGSTSHLNPQMEAWYRLGAEIFGPRPAPSLPGQGKPYREGRF